MPLFLLTLLFSFPVFFAMVINFIQAAVNNNPDKHSELLLTTHDMYNANKKALSELNHSKNPVPHKIFYEIVHQE